MDIKKLFKEKIVEITNLIITLLLFIIIVLKLPSSNNNEKLSSAEIKELANDLKSKGLYQQAIEVYKEYLKNSSISKRIRSNINYMIANIYEEYLKDFDNALLYYYKSKLIYPSTPLLNNINQKIVECLENSGRSREAQLALEESTLLNKDNKKKETSIIVAKIDNDIITLDDFNKWYNTLPEEIKEKYATPDKKKELLHQFIGQELMYRMALRKGYQNNPEILKKAFEIKKNLMIQKLMQDELLNKIKITKNDIELYYRANKDKYKAPLSKVYKQVYNDLMQEKLSEESQKLLQKMINANKVVIFDGNIK